MENAGKTAVEMSRGKTGNDRVPGFLVGVFKDTMQFRYSEGSASSRRGAGGPPPSRAIASGRTMILDAFLEYERKVTATSRNLLCALNLFLLKKGLQYRA